MNYIKISLLAFVSAMALLSCSKKNEVTMDGKTFQQSVTLPAKQANTTITLSGLQTDISSIDVGVNWLTVSKLTYTSGSPSVRLTASDNTGNTPRSCNVTISDESECKVILSVTQEMAEEQETGIDDSHDISTDQPAYGREF